MASTDSGDNRFLHHSCTLPTHENTRSEGAGIESVHLDSRSLASLGYMTLFALAKTSKHKYVLSWLSIATSFNNFKLKTLLSSFSL